MAHGLYAPTLFKLKGSYMVINNGLYKLLTLFSEKVDVGLCERKAVFFGERIPGQIPVAIKLRFQMNHTAQDDNIKQLATRIFRREIDALTGTAAVNSTPRMIAEDTLTQSPVHENPGGYLHVIVTHRVPGQSVQDYSDIEILEREHIKRMVIRAVEAIRACGWCVDQGQPDPDEIIYDRFTMTVSITCFGHVHKNPDDSSGSWLYEC